MTLASVLRLQPASLAYLAALTPSDWDIRIVDENIEPLLFEDADLVGITAYTNNAPRAYEISRLYRQRGTKTVIGGVHASMMCDEAARYVDSVVIGEAESVWPRLLSDFENNELGRLYRGERVCLENLVWPRRDLYSSRYVVKAFVQTARGCPNDCEFCSVTALNGRSYRQRPAEDVLDELEAIDSKNLFFTDDNFLGYGRSAEERAIQLFRGMIERGLDKRWVSQVGIDVANNSDLLKYAKKAGCLGVFIGFESLSEETLRSMSKGRNLKVGTRNYKEVVKKIRAHGIAVVGAFVFGGDGDTKDVFPRTTEFILDSKIDAEQLTIMTPLPGTRLYGRLQQEERLLRTDYPHDWEYYDFGEVVFRPRYLAPDELKEGVLQVYKDTTGRTTSLRRALDTATQVKTLHGAAAAYLWNRGYGSAWKRKYEYMKNADRFAPQQSSLVHPVADEQSPEEELVESH